MKCLNDLHAEQNPFDLLVNLLQKQHEAAVQFLKTEMGKDVNKASKDNLDINLTIDEIRNYVNRFHSLDKEKKGYISVNDLRRSFKVEKVDFVAAIVLQVLHNCLQLLFAETWRDSIRTTTSRIIT